MHESMKAFAYAGLAVAGFEINRRFIPNDVFLGRYNDLVFGGSILGAGLFFKNGFAVSFGAGATIEGIMQVIGL